MSWLNANWPTIKMVVTDLWMAGTVAIPVVLAAWNRHQAAQIAGHAADIAALKGGQP